ncbi:FAD dependent oxidoreductase [Hirsutella rhossiliensis]|uniref:FAD dependent oxidoreductase n=1 Tax=Hirsutella rhossiliensis TaxID=111463 RepID=A0A9P8N496_9HYPO|nr:FAD dependent oxidoreductase [Hirsutella rhossiliensis]KAH0965681.1 FAD dependent oxidoreductase [Hirsutella rhossiliensis]
MANSQGSPLPRADSPTRSPRSASVSLQAAATMNAGLQREPSRQSSSSSLPRNTSSPHAGRRRSTVLMNLQLNDPSIPAPGEMAHDQSDPHHHRAPSLGELHQELEAEQEAHVNRLLQMIRQQQLELQRLQQQPMSLPGGPPPATIGSYSRSPGFSHPRSSFDVARAELHRRSRTPSRGASPRLRATSISADSGDWVLGGRDESAFYQAETQMLVRENQMLRHRIRDLEKQFTDLSASSTSATEPTIPSQLTRSSTTADEGGEADASEKES